MAILAEERGGGPMSGAREMRREPWPIAALDQASGRILVFDPAAPDWNDDGAILWSWSPEEASSAYDEASGWGNCTDARLKASRYYGGRVFVVCASLGYAALVRYPEADRVLWSQITGGNPHAVDLLPDGNVAVAASQGGWVRVYAAVLGGRADVFAEFPLPGAHGVVWDERRQWLWAVGDEALTALRVAGTPEAPRIEEVPGERRPLPTPGGHDLFPVYGDADRLWVTTEEDIYVYVKSARRFENVPADSPGEYRRHVKSLVSWPPGQRMTAVPDAYKEPPGPCSARDNWTTDTIEIHPGRETRTRRGAAFYKARIWHEDYDGRR